MVRFGVNTWLWTDSIGDGISAMSAKIKKMGFDGVELPLTSLNELNPVEIKNVLERDKLSILCTGAFGPGRDIISMDSGVRKAGKNYIKRSVEFCQQVGSKIFSGPMYSSVGKITGAPPTKEEWELCVDGLHEVGEFALERGIQLAIEPLNRFETYFINTAADAIRLVKEVALPNVGVHLDTFHMNIEEKNIYEAVKSVKNSLFHVHISENDRGIPGTGQVDWEGLFKALQDIGYNRWLVIESFVLGVREIAKAAAIWREIAPNGDTLAQEGLNFLKRKLAQEGMISVVH